MKKFVLKVLLFFALVVVMDCAFGSVFSWLRIRAKGGSTANCEYIANRCEDDIIILGSSRATHHYVPQIIEDSLGLSCYNCGEEGNGVVLAYGRLLMLTNRYKPKLVLYEITPGYDYGTKEPNAKYLGYLRPYYCKNGIKSIFADFDDELSFLKMQSKMYQNTGKLLPDLVDNFVFRENMKGYAPLYGSLDTAPSQQVKTEMTIDSIKLSYVEKLIVLCKNNDIPLLFMISPEFNYGEDMTRYKPALQLCDHYGVSVINCINEPGISDNIKYFQDNTHLNNEGAVTYTQLLVSKMSDNVYQNGK